MGGFKPIFQSALRGDKTKLFDFFFIEASATIRFSMSRIFRYELPRGILSKRQKSKGGGGVILYTIQPPFPWVKG